MPHRLRPMLGAPTGRRARMTSDASLSGLHVLLVEDEADELNALVAVLSASGAEVTAVSKVEDALRALMARRPDVIVSDLMIPGHDGFTLIRRVRRMDEEEGRPALPALAVSGMDTPDQRRYAIEEGFSEFLPKPVHEHIVAVVSRLVRESTRA
jgi:CheY-like chemotaxis protein